MTKQVLSSSTIHYLMRRFPKIELSYETIPHKKVSVNYNICLAIPFGIKCYAWFTFDVTDAVCFIMELNKDKKITQVYSIPYPHAILRGSLVLGTLFYGTLLEETQSFIIEDCYLFKGVPMKNMYYGEKLGFIEKLFTKKYIPEESEIQFYLPTMWGMDEHYEYECVYNVPHKFVNAYPTHHIQYRCLVGLAPYLNVYPSSKKKNIGHPLQQQQQFTEIHVPYRCNPTKPQYKMPTVFKISADLQYDIYHLFAYGPNKSSVYYGVAYIPNYTVSVFMNNIFRKIKENKNLDAIEESDDEDDFQNMDMDKYVDLKKQVCMECMYNYKFKKWVPIKVVKPYEKIVHISYL